MYFYLNIVFMYSDDTIYFHSALKNNRSRGFSLCPSYFTLIKPKYNYFFFADFLGFVLTRSLRALPALNFGTAAALILIASPV